MDSVYSNNFLYFQEDGHKYTDTLGNQYTSVTTLIHDKYVPKFDKKYWLHKKSVELGISEKQLAKQWQDITDEACARGTKTHNRIEDGIKDNSMFSKAVQYLQQVESGRCITVADIPNLIPQPLDLDKFIEATDNRYEEIYRVFKVYLDRGYTIYSEIGAYIPGLLLSGTIDILCVKPDNFVILDWKTNRNGLQFTSGYYKKDKTTIPAQLTKEWVEKDERMLPPLGHLPNCNGMHYTMQLSTYARMVEYILGIPCVGLGLCHIGSPFVLNAYGQPFRDENNQYPIDPNGKETVKWYRIQYLVREVDAIFTDRYNQLEADKVRVNKQLNLFGEYED